MRKVPPPRGSRGSAEKGRSNSKPGRFSDLSTLGPAACDPSLGQTARRSPGGMPAPPRHTGDHCLRAACCSKKRENFTFTPPPPPPASSLKTSRSRARVSRQSCGTSSQPYGPRLEKLLRSLGVPDRLRIQRSRDTPPSLNRKTQHQKKKAPPRAGWRSLRRRPEEGSGVAAARGEKGSAPETRPARRAPSLPCRPLGMLRW